RRAEAETRPPLRVAAVPRSSRASRRAARGPERQAAYPPMPGQGCRLLLDHVVPLRTAALLGRDVVRLVVRLVDHRHRQDDLLRPGLLARGAHRRHHAQAALAEAMVVTGGQELARLDGLDRLLGAVDAHNKGCALRTLQRL